jgi:hypothetical protein
LPEFSVFTRLCGLCPHPASGIRQRRIDTKLRTLPLVSLVVVVDTHIYAREGLDEEQCPVYLKQKKQIE